MLIEAVFLALFWGSYFFTVLCWSCFPSETHLICYPKPNFQKNCGSPLIYSLPSTFHWALDVWWSNPNIFYVLMQNKQSQITHILPPYWFVEVVNQIKLPFLFLSFHLTYALGGSVLARTLNWNSLKHRASFVVRLFFPTRCLWKRTGFSLLGSGPSIAPLLPVWHSLSRSTLVNSRVLRTLFITLEGETLLILFWTCSSFAWNIFQQFLGFIR